MADEDRAAEIEAALTTKQLGKPVRYYPFAVTTESLAIAWARKEEGPEGAMIVANLELSPRQRKGPPWVPFPTGGLYFSVVLRPGLPPDGEGLLWLLASIGAAEGLAEITGLDAQVKWPDDIFVNGRKIGGIKIEAQLGPGEIVSAVVTGRFNINVAPEAFPPAISALATSVQAETGKPADPDKILNSVLAGIERRYDDDVPVMLKAYSAKCETIGRKVRAMLMPKGEVAGTALGIDPFGALLVDVGGKPVPVIIDTLRKLEPIQSQI
ncbi:MAG: biotin--[acetyl-CoA-carboxylase] ligase [Actinomycetota bacterium]